MPSPTHDVTNQSAPYQDINLFTTDRVLREAVEREGGGAAIPQLMTFGATCGSAEAFERGRLANDNPPRLRAFDEKGRRLDVVEFHPAYHECMALSMAEGLHCGSYEHLGRGPGAQPRPGANVVRAAGSYLAAQMEAGHCCPITMTNAAVATLLHQPGIEKAWLPRILNRSYDRAFAPIADKTSVTIGMGMTEKQGGTDVRANTTTAVPASGAGGPGAEYLLTGHKWFMSAPMSDAFLVLAQAAGGLSCFLVPRFLPDGTVNALRFQRLKDKLGNRSNASSEVEFANTHGWLIGEEGRGVAVIIDMVTHTRLDCVVSSAALMRLSLATAIHHGSQRQVFGKVLTQQPLMLSVLADLALDCEAATQLAFRLAGAFDRQQSEEERAWQRVMTPIAKYWVCKIAPNFVYEAMECLGGNGYVEENGLARIYREVPVNAIWEGSGNVMGLDVLRVLMKEPGAAALVLDRLTDQASGERRLVAHIERVRELLHKPREIEANARSLMEGLAMAAAACLLRAHAPAFVSDAFIAGRLDSPRYRTYGTAIGKADTATIVSRAAATGLR
jgi:putative acyl-CoA dehydrogenase